MNKSSRRSSNAQLAAMSRQWPDFRGERRPDGFLVWTGPLKPKAQLYHVGILWKPGITKLPFVWIIDPPIRPRKGAPFEAIPHLLFNGDDPERSGLCLFDSDGNEWSESDLIAETTVDWAAEWLLYYELWHLTGDWLAPGVGFESVAEMSAAEARAIREATTDVHG